MTEHLNDWRDQLAHRLANGVLNHLATKTYRDRLNALIGIGLWRGIAPASTQTSMRVLLIPKGSIVGRLAQRHAAHLILRQENSGRWVCDKNLLGTPADVEVDLPCAGAHPLEP